jgi:Protein kinase domain
MDRPDELGSLPTGDWGRIKDLADRCEQAWKAAKASGGTVDLNALLPARGDRLRPVVLYELIKIDMEFRWLRGQIITLDYYLEAFPEIGPADRVSPRLIYEEYRLSQLHGVNTPLPVYQKRFPRQFEEVKQLIEEANGATRPASELQAASGSSSGPSNSGLASINPLGSAHGAGAIVGGGYRLEKRIGSGAFGEVWRAAAPGGVEVAVKIIFRPLDNEEAKSELQAMELIKTLRHPFLLQTHAFWSEQDRLLIVMELADGSLRDRLKQCKKLGLNGIPAKELLTYFREAAEAVDYLHGRRLLHRDIKPDNLLLVEHHAKVADFGLARIMSTRRSAKVTGSGTPAYMAPEMWASQVNQYSDQYCLATSYAELRLAKPIFQGQDIIQLMRAHLQEAPLLATLPAREAEVLNRALAKDPLKRFASCGEFLEALTDAAQTGNAVRRDASHVGPGSRERQAPAPHPGLVKGDLIDDAGTLHPDDLDAPVAAPPQEADLPAVPDTDARNLATLAAAAAESLGHPARDTGTPAAPPSARPPGWRDTAVPVPTRAAEPQRPRTDPETHIWKPQTVRPSSGKKALLFGAVAALVAIALLAYQFWNGGTKTGNGGTDHATVVDKNKESPANQAAHAAQYESLTGDVRALLKTGKYKAAFTRVKDSPDLAPDEVNRLVQAIFESLCEHAERQFQAGELGACQEAARLGLDQVGGLSGPQRAATEQKLETLLILSWARDTRREDRQSDAMLARFGRLFAQDPAIQGKALAAAFIDLAEKSYPRWRDRSDVVRPVLARLSPADARPMESKLNEWRDLGATGDLLAQASTLFEKKDYSGSLACLKDALDKGTVLGPPQLPLVLGLAEASVDQGRNRNLAIEVLGKLGPGLPRAAKKQTEAYTAFLHGLNLQDEGQMPEAADEIVHAYALVAEPLPPPWAKLATDLLEKSAMQLPRGGTLAPFKPGDADRAFRWLDQARQLHARASQQLPEAARVKLALAADARAEPDSKPARQLADEVMRKDRVAQLDLDGLSLLLIRARAADEGAIQAYAAIDQHFKWKRFEKEGLDPKTWFTTVLQPAVVLGERVPNPHQKPAALRTSLAHCYAAYARFLHEHLFADEGQREKWVPVNPRQKVFDAYCMAVALDDSRADSWTGYAYSRTALPPVDWAEVKKECDKALELSPRSSAAHGLLGYMLLLQSRDESNIQRRIDKLREADQVFEKALGLAAQKKDDEDIPILLLNRSLTDLELGNYIAFVVGKAAREKYAKYLYAAETLARQASEVQHPYPQLVQEAWGNALEDIAMYLGESNRYNEAIEKFGNVIDARPYLASGYVSRGRVQYRLVHDHSQGAKGLDKEDTRRLLSAENDLNTAVANGRRSRDEAEAHYWKAMVRKEQNDLAGARKEFAEAIAVGWKYNGRTWVERAWLDGKEAQALPLADEVARLLRDPKRGYTREEAAGLLAKVSLVRGLAYASQGEEGWPQALKAYNQGLKGRPEGVDPIVAQLLLNRAYLQVKSKANVPRSAMLKDLAVAADLFAGAADKAKALALASLINTYESRDANAENPRKARSDAIALANRGIEYAGKSHPEWARMRFVLVMNLANLANETEEPQRKLEILNEAITRATEAIQANAAQGPLEARELSALQPLLSRLRSQQNEMARTVNQPGSP